ncbi:MAG: DUF2177 family protein [Alphaproteobacteria bacterium]|nr:DUF2177 family protein [Alphaproteobacteria bacterium]
MTTWLIGYAAASVVFLALDLFWLGFVAQSVYRPALDTLLRERVRLGPAVLFYLVYVGGVLALAVAPAVEHASFVTACLLGAVLGLVAYATYDFTNAATLKMWPAKVVFVDLAWGVFLTAVTSATAYLAITAMGPRAS